MSATTGNLPPPADPVCNAYNDPMTDHSYQITVPSAYSGSCTPAGGGLVNPVPWANEDDVCLAASQVGAGCGMGQVCAPAGNAAYTGTCIQKAGDQNCPKSWTKTVVYADGGDTRGCTACSCDGSTLCKGSKYTIYDNQNCTGSTTTFGEDGNCHDVSAQVGDGGYGVKLSTQPTVGMCGMSGGAPTGSLPMNSQTTFCCMP
jgi:hypothetical protein